MKIVAITRKGWEFFYDFRTAHSVSVRGAERICEMLNSAKYMLRDGYTWHVYDSDGYSKAEAYAKDQKFYIRNGSLKRVAERWMDWDLSYSIPSI